MLFRWDFTEIGRIPVKKDGLQIPRMVYFLYHKNAGVMESWVCRYCGFVLQIYQLMIWSDLPIMIL